MPESIISHNNTNISWKQLRLAQQRQLGLFNESEQSVEEDDLAVKQESTSYTRRKPKYKPFPKDLPWETIVHDIADSDRHNNGLGHELHCMGEDESEQREFVPASIKVIGHIRPKCSC